jgi:predicted MPP superfamily phosphohydrolase
MSSRWTTCGLNLLAAAGASFGWGLAEAHWFVLRQFEVPVLHTGFSQLRVLHLSDLHLTRRQQAKASWIRDLARLEPDLVVITGDLLAASDSLALLREAIEPFRGVPGVFVFGSNDYFAPKLRNPLGYLVRDSKHDDFADVDSLPTEALRELLTDTGWLDLNNARASLRLAGCDVSLVGTDDAHIDRDIMPARGAGAVADLQIGVTHAPYARVLSAFVADGVDIAFAGHTHGGQVCVPGYGALVTNCDLDTHRASGLSGWPGARPDEPGGADSIWLHVSAGLGTSPYAPFRFACRPEATLLTLVPRTDS